MKVLLVEDQPLCRDTLVELFRSRVGQIEPRHVAIVADALEALAKDRQDLIVVDFSTGDVCGRPGLEGIVQASHGATVITLDARHTASHLKRAMAVGAKAYIPKTSTRELFEAAIALVMAGGAYFPEGHASGYAEAPTGRGTLTRRQTDVLDLLHEGKANKEIAEALGISVATVKLHVHAILKATGAKNRSELLVRNAYPRPH